ncbi:MAG: hypothetical protein HC843_00820 [Sphingomonadales bacterium]|nr:hypothetical protein [Sphingomonadales bacterium]
MPILAKIPVFGAAGSEIGWSNVFTPFLTFTALAEKGQNLINLISLGSGPTKQSVMALNLSLMDKG